MISRLRRLDLFQVAAFVGLAVLFVWGLRLAANEPPPRDVGRWEGLVRHGGLQIHGGHAGVGETEDLGLCTWDMADGVVSITATDGVRGAQFQVGQSVRRWVKDIRDDGSMEVTLGFDDGRTVRWVVADGRVFQMALDGLPSAVQRLQMPWGRGTVQDTPNYWWIDDEQVRLRQGGSTVSFEVTELTDLVYRPQNKAAVFFTKNSFYGPFYTEEPDGLIEALGDTGLLTANAPLADDQGWRVEFYAARE